MFSGNGSASASSMCTTIERQTSEHRPVPAVLPSRRAVRDFDCCLRMCRVHIYIRCARTQVPPSLSAMLHPRPAKAIGWRRAGIEIACFQLSQPLLPEVKSKQRTLGSRNWREGRNESARNETAGRTGRMYRVEAGMGVPPRPRDPADAPPSTIDTRRHRTGQRGACNVPPSREQRTGYPDKKCAAIV